MGLPVPFSSLGAVVPLLLSRLAPAGMGPTCASQEGKDLLSVALFINAMQVTPSLCFPFSCLVLTDCSPGGPIFKCLLLRLSCPFISFDKDIITGAL